MFQRRIFQPVFVQNLLSYVNHHTRHSSRISYTVMNNRAVLSLTGADHEIAQFCQGLITNDVRLLQGDNDESLPNGKFKTHIGFEPRIIHGTMLNEKGRFLYDIMLLWRRKGEFWLDCHQTVVELVEKYLNFYKLRKKIKIEPMRHITVSSLIGENVHADLGLQTVDQVKRERAERNGELDDQCNTSLCDPIALPFKHIDHGKEFIVVCDPRSQSLGVRVYSEDTAIEKISALIPSVSHVDIESISDYEQWRVFHGIADQPDGSHGTSVALEMNYQEQNGISFQKGCYVGQELMARVFYTGVLRKRLIPMVAVREEENSSLFQIDRSYNFSELKEFLKGRPELNVPEQESNLILQGNKSGRIQSNYGKIVFALLRIESITKKPVDTIKSNTASSAASNNPSTATPSEDLQVSSTDLSTPKIYSIEGSNILLRPVPPHWMKNISS